jgi:glycine betaine/proline transport system permease protein
MPDVLTSSGWQLPRLPVGDWFNAAARWLQNNLGGFFDFLKAMLESVVDGITTALTALPSPAMVVIFAVLVLWLRGWKQGLFSLIGFGLIDSMGEFDAAMQTLAQVLFAGIIAVIIAVPAGILAAQSDTASKIIGPVLDFLRSLPAPVYLIPVVFLFSVGVVPGLLATIIFALPPGVRLTELGIRGVDRELVEAGEAFGSAPAGILTGIQLPLAMPSIMAGINQIIMLSLSMVVIAGMVDGPGLGQEIFDGVTGMRLGNAVEAGIGVVILAILLDRITTSPGDRAARRGRNPAGVGIGRTQRAATARKSR